jgi:hypothetical protein
VGSGQRQRRRWDGHLPEFSGANGFAGVFAENQATVTWSETSASGFTFTSKPGSFSTSVPEVPGVNGVTAPLNFFAQVGFERNGIFFAQGESHVNPATVSVNGLAPSSIQPANAAGWDLLGTQHPIEVLVVGQTAARLTPPLALGGNALADTHPTQPSLALDRMHSWTSPSKVFDQVFANLDSSSLWDALQDGASAVWTS